jgi:hypothetical protein
MIIFNSIAISSRATASSTIVESSSSFNLDENYLKKDLRKRKI